MNQPELSWGVASLAAFGICFVAFFGPQFVEHLARYPDKVPHHSGNWIVAWIISLPILIENGLVQLAKSAASILVIFLVNRFCIHIGYLLRKISWSWLPRVLPRPSLEMWDSLILNWSMCFCFNFSLFLFLYLVSTNWDLTSPIGDIFLYWCKWLLYIGVFVLWLKWILSRYYCQIEEWIDSFWLGN